VSESSSSSVLLESVVETISEVVEAGVPPPRTRIEPNHLESSIRVFDDVDEFFEGFLDGEGGGSAKVDVFESCSVEGEEVDERGFEEGDGGGGGVVKETGVVEREVEEGKGG